VFAASMMGEPCWAARAKSKHKKRSRRPTPAPRVEVTPGLDIEKEIVAEIARAENILDELRPDNALDSAYLISAIYYHDGLLDKFPEDRPQADPASRVVAHIARVLTAERRQSYVALLHAICGRQGSESSRLVLPVAWAEPQGKRKRRRWIPRNHKNAIDLFAPEGASVFAASGGLVLLAEGGWQSDQPFSTSSLRGGNAVIVFNPAENRFYRYCHLEKVLVRAGTQVEAGHTIGAVGHTGFNASRPGHGGHLHFEINQYDGRTVHALDDKQLRAWLAEVSRKEA
jgi:murein DD-endopeptidase MepM/ murein hydrolase activator NlpD